MIKISLQSLCYRDTFKGGKIDLVGIIEKAYEMRLDGVDLHYAQFASREPAYLEGLQLACLKRGLRICYIGVSNDFGKSGAELEKQKNLVRDWVDVAAQMGVPMVRVFGAWAPKGEAEAQTWPRLLAATKEVTAYARSKRVVLGLHNHNHGCVPATGEQVLRLLDEVNDPYYTHILDTGQYRGGPGASAGERGDLSRVDELYASIAASAPRAVHVRAKVYRVASGEERWLDYDRVLSILKSAGFNGWMSVVFEGQDELDEETGTRLGAAYLRRKLGEQGI